MQALQCKCQHFPNVDIELPAFPQHCLDTRDDVLHTLSQKNNVTKIVHNAIEKDNNRAVDSFHRNIFLN